MKKWKYLLPIVIVTVIVYRVLFDWSVYEDGATLVIRNESRSGYDYLLQLPRGYHAASEKRPLLIYLHGAGEVGKDVTDLIRSNPSFWSRDTIDEKEYPFITVSPITTTHGWEPNRIKTLVEELTTEHDRFRIDSSRVYLTGFSMGGFGTFDTAQACPELFAAVAPIAGGGNIGQAQELKSLPIWAFHGDADTAVSYECSKEMIDAIRKSGSGLAQLTTFPGAGHGIVTEVYRNPQLYQWFLQHRREK